MMISWWQYPLNNDISKNLHPIQEAYNYLIKSGRHIYSSSKLRLLTENVMNITIRLC